MLRIVGGNQPDFISLVLLGCDLSMKKTVAPVLTNNNLLLPLTTEALRQGLS